MMADHDDTKHPIVTTIETAAPVAVDYQPAGLERFDVEEAQPAKARSARRGSKESTATGHASAAGPDGALDRKRAPAQRDSLMSMTAHCGLWRGADNEAYINFAVPGHRENWRIRSSRFKNWLSAKAFEEMGIVPGAQAIEDTIRILEARAQNEGMEREPLRRVGRVGDRVVIDMGDPSWRAIEVTAAGWKVVERHDHPFIRSPAMRALPDPVAGESIDLLRPFVNPATEADFAMMVAWQVAALAGVAPFPVLVINGQQGTGKSVVTALLRNLVDPNVEPLRTLPQDARDFAVASVNSYVLCFDNISFVDSEMSDVICRASTGAGFATRGLHTDRDEIVMRLLNPVLMNGIPTLTERADLADRMIAARLKVISGRDRRPLREVQREWELVAPMVLGALLDGVSSGLRNLEKTKLEELPRMADFAKWVTACEPGLGWEPGTFMRHYAENRKEAVENAFEADHVASAVFALAMDNAATGWRGSPTELFEALGMRVSESVRRNQRAWPTSAQVLGNRMERAAPLLRARGVHFETRKSGTRQYVVWVSEQVKAGNHG